MTARTYLSIGDVLTLLREEFPDVTISKIRFLESQGLVNPERSPSGYRKFFETDVERLRWVLRQQREHFLPLKVIRDRLADGDLGEDEGASAEAAAEAATAEATTPEPVTAGNGRVPQPAHAATGARGGGAPAARAAPEGPLRRHRHRGTGTVPAAPPSPDSRRSSPRPTTRRWRGFWPTHLAALPVFPRRADPLRSLHAIPDPAAPAPAGPRRPIAAEVGGRSPTADARQRRTSSTRTVGAWRAAPAAPDSRRPAATPRRRTASPPPPGRRGPFDLRPRLRTLRRHGARHRRPPRR